MSSEPKATRKLLPAILLYLLLGLALILLLPPQFSLNRFDLNSFRPLLVSIVVGLSISTALSLCLVKQVLRLGWHWFWFALAFNCLIILVKFVLSPSTFISATTATPFSSYVLIGLIVMLLYLFGLWAINAYFQQRLPLKLQILQYREGFEAKLLFTAGLFMVANLAQIIIQKIPLASVSSGANYLSAIYGAQGLALSVILFLVIYFAVEAFDQTRKSGMPKLQSFYIYALAIMMINHFLWVVFMSRLA